MENKNISWSGIITWALATTCGQIAINHNFLIPAVVSMVVAFVLYIVVSKIFDKKA